MELIKDIQPKGMSSAYVEAPFDEGKVILEKAGYQIPSLEEMARLKMQAEISDVCKNGNWVKEGFLYIPDKGKFLTKASPIMIYPVRATKSHKEKNEFYLTDEEAEIALRDSVKLPPSEYFSIPTNKFEEDETTVYVFGNSVQKYGNFLKDAGIKEMFVWMFDMFGKKPFARPIWLDGFGNDSGLVGYSIFYKLNSICYVRGVRED